MQKKLEAQRLAKRPKIGPEINFLPILSSLVHYYKFGSLFLIA